MHGAAAEQVEDADDLQSVVSPLRGALSCFPRRRASTLAGVDLALITETGARRPVFIQGRLHMQALLRVGLPLVLVAAASFRLAAGSVPIGKAEDVGLSTERLKRIGEAVQRHITAGNVAGAVTLVARRGKIAHFEAQGVMDVDTKKPMAKENLFRLASMSKPITGVAVMMLVEEGKIRQHAWVRGRYEDELVMSVLREEWTPRT